MLLVIIITILAVFGIPFLAVLFATDAGMAVCLLSFYIINPVVSILNGVFSGKDLKKQWYAHLFVPAIFLITAWSLFTFTETIFIVYAAVYLLLGAASTLITSLVTKK